VADGRRRGIARADRRRSPSNARDPPVFERRARFRSEIQTKFSPKERTLEGLALRALWAGARGAVCARGGRPQVRSAASRSAERSLEGRAPSLTRCRRAQTGRLASSVIAKVSDVVELGDLIKLDGVSITL
jgi:hypothetical protein